MPEVVAQVGPQEPGVAPGLDGDHPAGQQARHAAGLELRIQGDQAGAFTVRLDRGGKRLVTDGPFTETKEQLGSFYVIECPSQEEAVAIAQDVPASPGLVVEAWPVADM